MSRHIMTGRTSFLASVILATAISGCVAVDAPRQLTRTARVRVEVAIPAYYKWMALFISGVLAATIIWRRRTAMPTAVGFSTIALALSATIWVRGYAGHEGVAFGTHQAIADRVDVKEITIFWNRGGICFQARAFRYNAGGQGNTTARRLFDEQARRPNPFLVWTRTNFLKYPVFQPATTTTTQYSFWQRHGFQVKTGGFHTGFSGSSNVPSTWAIISPCWFPTLLFAILPGWWVTRFVRRLRRKRAGHCPTCNYDLRASTDRCPECGTPIPPPPSPTHPAPRHP